MSKKAAAKAVVPTQETAATLSPSYQTNGVGFTPDQVVNTASHVLAIPGWVEREHVITLVDELLELMDDEDVVNTGERVGTEANIAQYAVLAGRLIRTYDLPITMYRMTTEDSIGVELTDAGPTSVRVVNVLAEILDELGLPSSVLISRTLIDNPGYLFSVNGEDKALDIQKRLAAVGATVEVSR